MSEANATPYTPEDPRHLPDDLRAFVEGLAEDGITVWLPISGDPDWELPEPIRANTSLSDAIIEERGEDGR